MVKKVNHLLLLTFHKMVKFHMLVFVSVVGLKHVQIEPNKPFNSINSTNSINSIVRIENFREFERIDQFEKFDQFDQISVKKQHRLYNSALFVWNLSWFEGFQQNCRLKLSIIFYMNDLT